MVVSASATHIVGGEFEIIHIEGDRYMFRLIQYFDFINGNPNAEDLEINASIFRKSDNLLKRGVRMYQTVDTFVQYSNPSCSNDNVISTKRIVYQTELTLDPEEYDDPEGYYLVWERCCRNNTITNIVDPENTGQTFYLEFPPLMKNGERFINSTPSLFPPLQDYACVNQFYYADFKGFDKDGDSLVYSLVTPFNSSEAGAPLPNPLPSPKPNPRIEVNWLPGFSKDIQVDGPEPLNISQDGLLRVTPGNQGLFVFSVKCEEFRDGEKIGEVRRDFQLFVVDCPPPGNKPVIQAKAPGSTEFKADISNVTINYGDDSCFEIIVNDKDPGENIRIRAIPINFEDTLQQRLSINQGIINDPDDTLKIEFCLPHCINNGKFDPAIIDLLVYDNRCPQSLIDTLRINAFVNQPPNNDPVFTLPTNRDTTFSLIEGGKYSIPIEAIDADADFLDVYIEAIDFDPEDYGINLVKLKDEAGEVSYEIQWDVNCSLYEFSEKDEFEFYLLVEDFDECLKDNADSIYYHVNIELPFNNPPVVKFEGSETDEFREIKIEELRNLFLTVEDADLDSLILMGVGKNFQLANYGLTFSDVKGKGSINHPYDFRIDCDFIGQSIPDTLEIYFIGEDFDKCRTKSSDTLLLSVKLFPPDNNPPIITVNGSSTNNDTIQFIVGQSINLPITSDDLNGDNVTLSLMEELFFETNYAIDFSSSTNGSSATGTLSWSAVCDLLSPGFKPGIYSFQLESLDDKCIVPDTTIHNFSIKIIDMPQDQNFLPPNVFTPNEGDDLNAEFFIPNLPIDNCENIFEQIIILNRWGQEVYRSNNRDFHWDGMGYSTGVYYYTLIFSNKTYKGIVSILR